MIPDNPPEHSIDPIVNHTMTIEVLTESHNKSVIDKWNSQHDCVTDKDTITTPQINTLKKRPKIYPQYSKQYGSK